VVYTGLVSEDPGERLVEAVEGRNEIALMLHVGEDLLLAETEYPQQDLGEMSVLVEGYGVSISMQFGKGGHTDLYMRLLR